MKAFRIPALFSIMSTCFSACFDQPRLSIAPKIEFNRVEFKVTPNQLDADSLILYIDFRDGNGDMGLTSAHVNDPYHELNYYFEDAANNTVSPVGTEKLQVSINGLLILPVIVATPTGKLVTNRTRSKPGFGSLPLFQSGDLDCRDYTNNPVAIAPTAREAIDDSYHIAYTFSYQDQEYYVLNDTTYFERNLSHYNFIVRFFQSSGGPYTEFSFEDNYCQTMNGRFPFVTGNEGALEGTIRYAMASTGFIPIFGNNNLRLDVIVKDRMLLSDSIRTPEFTLESIRVGN